MKYFNTFLVFVFMIVATTCFAKPIDKEKNKPKSLSTSSIVLQMKSIDEKASKVEATTKEMLIVLRKLIKHNKLKNKSFLRREIK